MQVDICRPSPFSGITVVLSAKNYRFDGFWSILIFEDGEDSCGDE